MQRSHKEAGFHLIEISVVAAVLIIAGLIGYKVFHDTNKPALSDSAAVKQSENNASQTPVWTYNQQNQEWMMTSGTAPECPQPLLSRSPVDMTQVIAVSLPGAYRGFNYKAHGGFRLSQDSGGKTNVVLPMDARLMGITRYYEAIPGQPHELQYIVDFENDCGIALRFDHLQTLSPELQKYAEKTPEPKKDDTRSDPNTKPFNAPMKAGALVATAVGFPRAQNYGFDFGVYDYRSRNKMSQNKQWAAIHEKYSAQAFHATCWLPLLPQADAARAEALAKDRNNYNSSKPFYLVSDYCEFAPYNTLDFNNGQPTEG